MIQTEKGKVSLHQLVGLCVDEVLHAAARSNSLDNISVVMVALEPLQKLIEEVN
jgi:hypothetical protein